MKSIYLPYAILCVLLLSACFGSDNDNDEDELTYTGNSEPSSIDASNTGEWTFMGLGGAQSTGSFNPLSAGGTDEYASKHGAFSSHATRPHIPGLELALTRHAVSLSSGKTASSGGNTNQVSIQEAVNENETCDNSGTVKVTGNEEANGNQQLTLSYSNCEMAGVLTDGVVKVNVTNASSDGSFDATFDFQEFTSTGDDFDLIQNGEVALSLSMSDGLDQTMVLDLVIEDETAGTMVKFESFSSRFWEEPGESPTGRFTISGRIYDSILGYVDFTTEETFVTSTPGVMPPDYSGILRISGSNGSHALVEAGHDSAGSFFTIKVDADNDGTYEINAVIPHQLLDSDFAADLGDSDGDGMHNSWETGYQLDPEDPADANGDADGDGANNLMEYDQGYDPRDSGSIPPP
jgi:hypothetical protein